jgi:hypothetical protein
MDPKLQVWEHGDTIFGRLTLPLRGGGALSVSLSCTQAQVVAYMHQMGIRFTESDKQQIGSLFGSIGKLVKKVAKNSVIKGVLKIGTGIVGSPLVKLIAPQAALAVEAANGAAKMIAAAKKGNPKAKLALKAAVAQAELEKKEGQQLPVPSGVAAKGPHAAIAYRYLVTVNKA